MPAVFKTFKEATARKEVEGRGSSESVTGQYKEGQEAPGGIRSQEEQNMT